MTSARFGRESAAPLARSETSDATCRGVDLLLLAAGLLLGGGLLGDGRFLRRSLLDGLLVVGQRSLRRGGGLGFGERLRSCGLGSALGRGRDGRQVVVFNRHAGVVAAAIWTTQRTLFAALQRFLDLRVQHRELER